MIRLREPYIKPPQIVDRKPEPVVAPEYSIGAVSGVINLSMSTSTLNVWSSYLLVRQTNRFISASGYWHCAANWSLGHVPNQNENVVISGVGQVYCLVHGDVAIYDLTVANRVHLELGDHVFFSAHTLNLEPNAWLNMNSSTWIMSGDWNAGDAHINAGTSTVNFAPNGVTYTSSGYITTTGSAFYGTNTS